jgi:hypothetical protein
MVQILLLTIFLVATLLVGGTVDATNTEHDRRLQQQEIFTDKNAFVDAVQSYGLSIVSEGFEQNVWDQAQVYISQTTPPTPSITKNQLTWTSNVPGNNIRVGTGPALNGARGVFSLPHGNQSAICTNEDYAGTSICPWVYDGWIVTNNRATPLYAVGGYLETNTPYASLEFLLDGTIVDFGADAALGTSHKFFGVINFGGFDEVEMRETDGVLLDQKLIYGDQFFFGSGTLSFPDPTGTLAPTPSAPSPVSDQTGGDDTIEVLEAEYDEEGGEFFVEAQTNSGTAILSVHDGDGANWLMELVESEPEEDIYVHELKLEGGAIVSGGTYVSSSDGGMAEFDL